MNPVMSSRDIGWHLAQIKIDITFGYSSKRVGRKEIIIFKNKITAIEYLINLCLGNHFILVDLILYILVSFWS